MKAKPLSLRYRLICAMPYVLLHWLIREQILHKYCNRIIEQENISFIEYLERKPPKDVYSLLIDGAFIWDETLEGYNFWYRRGQWFREYLTKNYQNL